MLAFLESLEFLEILRLLKLENFITMVRRNLGSATPPSVMALFLLNHTICSIRGKRRGGELEGYQMCR